MIDVKEVLMEFMRTPAPAGYEKEMSYKMKGYFERFCDEVFIDNVGNCIGKIDGTDPQAPKAVVSCFDRPQGASCDAAGREVCGREC